MKKRKISFILILIIITLSTPISVRADNINPKVKTIKIAGDYNYPPYEYFDKNGVYKGFNVDIMRAISIEMGLDIELIPMPWQKAIEALEKGEVDAVQGMTKSSERGKNFSFTKKLVTNSQVIFVKSDTNYIFELKDLSGIKVSIQKGDISEELIKTIPNVEIITSENQEMAIDSLITGKVDAFVGNYLTGIYYLQRKNLSGQIKTVGEPMFTTDYCSAVLKEDYETLVILNNGIDKIKANGTYEKIYNKWFGELFIDKSLYFKKLLFVSLFIIVTTLFIIMLIAYLNRKLKIVVKNRTKEIEGINIELQERQHDLIKSNKFMEEMLNGIVDGIVTFDFEGNLLTANPAARDILGCSLESGTNWESLSIFKYLNTENLVTSLNSGVIRKNIDISGTNNNIIQNITCIIIPINLADENIGDFMLLLHDYSSEKKMQDIINSNEKMQTIGKLAAGIAHEIRNPLTSIKAFVELIPYKIENEIFRNELIKVLPSEIHRINNLVTSLLDFAKPRNAVPQIIKMRDIIAEIHTFMKVSLGKKNIKFSTYLDYEFVFADVQQLKQILINTILNSIDSIENGGKIDIFSSLKDNLTEIKVSDSGCGIPEESMNKIFDPFYTLKSNGYGLGLPNILQLLKENNGNAKIESTQGIGTTVFIYLPSAQKEEKFQ